MTHAKIRNLPVWLQLWKRVHQLTSTADPAEHARFRKIMTPGFSQARLDELENVIMQSGVEAFLNKLDSLYADKGVACNLFIEFHCLAMDILGELAYGKSFNMIQSQRHPFTQWLRVGKDVWVDPSNVHASDQAIYLKYSKDKHWFLW
jgi:cytochrome P450